jgi:nickel-dependent lactate racemase
VPPSDLPTLGPAPSKETSTDLPAAVDEALAVLSPADRGNLTVLVNDPQRHTDSLSVLAELMRRDEGTLRKLLIACGTHRFEQQKRTEFEKTLMRGLDHVAPSPPAEVIPIEIAWHDATAGDLVTIGEDSPEPSAEPSRQGWRGHPWLAGPGGLLAVGSVEPHYFAGFTGAHKTCTIGVADRESIEANHAHALSPQARPGAIAGNPVHDGHAAMLARLEATRPVAAVNLVQAGRSVLGVFGGAPAAALRAAEPLARASFFRTIPRPADALVLQATGPLGGSFYQADKAIKNNEWAVRDGGVLVLVAPCPAGVGQDHFLTLLRDAATYAEALDIVRARGYRLGDHKAVKLRYLTDPACRGVRVFVVSDGLDSDACRTLGFCLAESVNAALEKADVTPGRGDVYRVEDAGNLVVNVGA